MPLDINCFKIEADINSACDLIKIGDYKQVGIMFPYEDLDRASLSIVGCVADFELLVPSAIRIYDTSFVPFKGSEVTEENKERFKEYMDTVMIPLFNMTPENAYVYTKLALSGQRWVVILGIEEGTEAEQNLFQVFGITSGLYVKSKTVDKANQAYLSVTMSQVNSQYPAVFFFDTDKATIEAKIDSWLDFNLIYGGTIATGGAVKLTIDIGKKGYIKLPNGSVLTTVAGVINTTYTGVGGRITYYVSKTNMYALLGYTGLSGRIETNISEHLDFNGCNLTSIIANDLSYLLCLSNVLLTNLIAPKATVLVASDCALTAKAIGDILYAAYVDNRANVIFNFGGGTNANDTAVGDYLGVTYGISLFVLLEALTGIGGSGGIIYLNATPPPIP